MKRPKKTGDPNVDAAIQDTVRDLPRLVSCGRVDIVTAGAPFTVPHKLGEVPDLFDYVAWTDLNVFATDTLQAQWTKDTIVLCSSVAGTITLFVGKL